MPIPTPPNVAINKNTRILANNHLINEYAVFDSIYNIVVYYFLKIEVLYNRNNRHISIT